MLKPIFNILLFFFFFLSIKSYKISQYELDSIDKLSHYGNKIQVLKGKTNKTKCISKTDLKINDTIFTFEKSDILSSETCYYPNKTGLLYNITFTTKNYTIFTEYFTLAACLYYILDNYNDEKMLSKVDKKTRELVKKLPIQNYEFAEFSFDNDELNEYLITSRNYYVEKSDFIKGIGERLFDEYYKNKTKSLLFGSLFYYIEEHSFMIEGSAILIPYFDICNIYPHYLTIQDKNFTNSTEIIEFEDQFIIRVKRPFLENEQFAFGYNHSYNNEEMLTKNGIFFRDNIYDTHKIIKHYYYEQNYKSDGILHYLRRRNLDPRLLNYAQEENGHELFVEFNITSESINPIIFKYALIYFTWDKMEKNQQNSRFKHIGKQSFLFILQLIYDELKEIEDKSEVNFFDYLLATQKEKNKRMKIIKEFNLETCNLLFKNINYLYPDLINISWKEIEHYKDKYIIIDPNTLVDRK